MSWHKFFTFLGVYILHCACVCVRAATISAVECCSKHVSVVYSEARVSFHGRTQKSFCLVLMVSWAVQSWIHWVGHTWLSSQPDWIGPCCVLRACCSQDVLPSQTAPNLPFSFQGYLSLPCYSSEVLSCHSHRMLILTIAWCFLPTGGPVQLCFLWELQSCTPWTYRMTYFYERDGQTRALLSSGL